MQKCIKVGVKKKGHYKQRPVNAYKQEDGRAVFYRSFESISHAAASLDISRATLHSHVKKGTPVKGYLLFYRERDLLFYRERDPNLHIAARDAIDPSDDLPVVSFFRDDNEPIARFKSVKHLHNCIGYSVRTILSWLKGGRCTDPDCYYKYEKDCTPQQLAILERNEKTLVSK